MLRHERMTFKIREEQAENTAFQTDCVELGFSQLYMFNSSRRKDRIRQLLQNSSPPPTIKRTPRYSRASAQRVTGGLSDIIIMSKKRWSASSAQLMKTTKEKIHVDRTSLQTPRKRKLCVRLALPTESPPDNMVGES